MIDSIRKKTVFSIPESTFEPMVMFFGLTNLLATFQTIMNDLLRDMIEAGNVAVFINDVMVEIEIEKGHNEIVKEVLKRIAENDLFIKPEKHVWKVKEVGFLGVVIGLDRVKMEKEKVQRVVDWPVPRNVKDVQKFLGLANYYRQFVKDFTRVAKPLHEMMRKDVKWNWEEMQQKTFQELKERLMIELVLVILDLNKKMRVETNALDFAMGEVLPIKCENGKWRPVACISKSLNETERNYGIYDKEMLVIIRCLEA